MHDEYYGAVPRRSTLALDDQIAHPHDICAMKDIALIYAGMAIVSASTIGTFAYIGSRRQSMAFLLVSVLVAWGGTAMALGYDVSVSSLNAARNPLWRYVLEDFAAIAPMVLIPTALVAVAVSRRSKIHTIALLAISGSVLALPCTAISSLYSSSYIAFDCL